MTFLIVSAITTSAAAKTSQPSGPPTIITMMPTMVTTHLQMVTISSQWSETQSPISSHQCRFGIPASEASRSLVTVRRAASSRRPLA